MAGSQVEYVGFTTNATVREYVLRVKQAEGEFHSFTLAIPHQAFLSRRVRYQDGPDVCFLKLQRELVLAAGGLPATYLSVSDAELEEYRVAHAPKAPQRRPKVPQPT